MNIRLFWILFPGIVLVCVVTLLLMGWLASSSGRTFYIDQTLEELTNQARMLETSVHDHLQTSPEKLREFVRTAGRKGAIRITVVDLQGTVLADSDEDPSRMDNHGSRPELVVTLQGSNGASIRFSQTLGQNMLYAAIPVKESGIVRYALRLSRPTADLEEYLAGYHRKLGLVAALLMVLAGVVAFFFAKRISRPLERMKVAADHIIASKLDATPRRIATFGMSAESAALAMALNRMSEQISSRVGIIKQQRGELEAVFASMVEPVVAIDAHRTILRMNQAAAEFFQLTADRVKGQEISTVIRNQELKELITRVFDKGTPVHEQITFNRGGENVTLQIHAAPLKNRQESIGVLLVMNDLTKIKWLENIRQEFVANVSHELKTPITAIRGYVETLQDGAADNPEDVRSFLEIIRKQATRLDAIVEDLLTLSRLESRDGTTASFDLSTEPIRPVLETAVQTCAVLAAEKNITLQLDEGEEILAGMNRPLLEQAVINLVVNAVSYSPGDTVVTLQAFADFTPKGEPLALINVIDQGPGIAREHLSRLFERFYRCDRARSRDLGGTGLGLAIVKHIAQIHHGAVKVKSQPGQGSTFTIIVPRVIQQT